MTSGGGRPDPEGRLRMVTSAAKLLGARGASRTSFSAVVGNSRAPRGSIYYYFPSGKTQLIEEAVRWTSEQVMAYQRGCRARTPEGVVSHFTSFFRASLVVSRCTSGCPVAAVALGPLSIEESLGGAVRTSFHAWSKLLATQLAGVGVPRRDVGRLSVTILAAVEGALILCRAEGRLTPLDQVSKQLQILCANARSRSGASHG